MLVKFCKNCEWSRPEPGFEFNLLCTNPIVNKNDPWALASGKDFSSTSCREERKGRWFSKCGMKGKLWEQKHAKFEHCDRSAQETLKHAIDKWNEECQ